MQSEVVRKNTQSRHTSRLYKIDEDGVANDLSLIYSGLFAKTKQLAVLDLSDNELTSDAFNKLVAVSSLLELRLNNNKQLGDACLIGNGIYDIDELRLAVFPAIVVVPV